MKLTSKKRALLNGLRTPKALLFQSAMLIMALLALSFTPDTPTIYIIGDSTAAEKDISKGQIERGWGMVLQGFFDEGIRVENHAKNGQSSRSFYREGRWKKVIDKVKPGDYVIIQFGHNDEKPKPDRHTDVGTTFDAHLAQYVVEVKAKGATPILMSPVVRRNFYLKPAKQDDDEKLRETTYQGETVNSDTLVDTHGEYARVAERVAKKYGAVFIDAHKITHDIEQSAGVVGSRKLHMWLEPGKYDWAPKGRQDNTHYTVYGAHIVAGALADALGNAIPALKPHIRHFDYIVSDEGRGNFMTPEEAVAALPNGKSTVLILHGKFAKPAVPRKKKVTWVFFDGLNWNE